MDGRSLPSWSDDDLVPISALESWSYCPRQCGLIQVEQIFDENRYTLRGRRVHERIDSGEASTERGVRQLRAITLWSDRLGLIGKSDVIEWHDGRPMPIETKSGTNRGRDRRHESIQLCAQAICLEEMLGVPVSEGAIYSAADRRRMPIIFDDDLRRSVEEITIAIRAMIGEQRLPPALNDHRCPNCAQLEGCAPDIAAHPHRVKLLHAGLFRMLPAEEALAAESNGSEDAWNS